MRKTEQLRVEVEVIGGERQKLEAAKWRVGDRIGYEDTV